MRLATPIRRLPILPRSNFPHPQLAEWAEERGGAYWDRIEHLEIDLPTPSWSERIPSTELHLRAEIALVPNGEVFFANNLAFDARRRALYEPSLRFEALPAAFQRLERPEPVPGQVAYLSNTWPDNFMHFMLFTLPLVHLYRACGLEPEKYYTGSPLKSWQIEVLDLLGISSDRLLTGPSRPESAVVACLTRNLAGPSLGGVSSWSPGGAAWLRAKLAAPPAASRTRRLYVERGTVTTRRLLGEAEIAARLEAEYGFERIDMGAVGMSERAGLLAEASHVVMPVGAAATNLLYLAPGTKILGILPGFTGHIVYDYFQKLAGPLELELGLLTGRPHHDDSIIDLAQDIDVDPDRLFAAVDGMLADS